jgi:tetratricopeptide (TPR) repeat protein
MVTRDNDEARKGTRRSATIVVVVLLVATALRLLYLWAQPSADPSFAHPAQDGDYYLQWARAIAAGEGRAVGAYYLAPLFPHVLALFLVVFGENFAMLYLFQQLLGLATALVIAIGGRALIGARAALIATALFLLHHPLVFFSSRPLGEPLALFFLFASWALAARTSGRSALCAGLLAGVGALARPNLLLVPLFWALADTVSGRWRQAALLIGGVSLVLLPVALRNAAVSGHPVLVSSNSGITAYHGNGLAARGVYTMPAGFSGELGSQRDEATALARLHAGRELDPVEADRWWGREALRVRLADPWGSAWLLLRRASLLLDNYEYGLDAHPMLDGNPWRPTWRLPEGRELALVPFALLLGLAVAGLAMSGVRGTGGWWTWSAIVAAALTPLLFYVSSRYRLPTAALLVIPAGCGLNRLIARDGNGGGRLRALIAGGAVLALSLGLSWIDLSDLGWIRRTGQAEALANRAAAHQHAGDLEAADRDARRATALAPWSARSRFNLAVIAEARGRLEEAEQSYREALELSEGALAEAAANLAKIMIDRGQADQAVSVLTRALEARPTHETCWTNLVVALMLSGRREDAAEAVRRALALGAALDPGLVTLVEPGLPPKGSAEETP